MTGRGGRPWRGKSNLGGTDSPAPRQRQRPPARSLKATAPGFGSLALTRDGKTAYVAFGLPGTLLNIDLSTGEIAGGSSAAIRVHRVEPRRALAGGRGPFIWRIGGGAGAPPA